MNSKVSYLPDGVLIDRESTRAIDAIRIALGLLDMDAKIHADDSESLPQIVDAADEFRKMLRIIGVSEGVMGIGPAEANSDFVYTAADAKADGVLKRIAADVHVTTNALSVLSRDAIDSIVNAYRAGIYADPPEADRHNEANVYFAYYIREDIEVLVQRDGDGFTLMLALDY